MMYIQILFMILSIFESYVTSSSRSRWGMMYIRVKVEMNFIHDSLDNKWKHENFMITKFIQISHTHFLRKKFHGK